MLSPARVFGTDLEKENRTYMSFMRGLRRASSRLIRTQTNLGWLVVAFYAVVRNPCTVKAVIRPGMKIRETAGEIVLRWNVKQVA